MHFSTVSKQNEVQVLQNRIAEIATKKSLLAEEKSRFNELNNSVILKLSNLERDLQRAEEENEIWKAHHSAKEAALLVKLEEGNQKIADIKEEEQVQNIVSVLNIL